ncbi:MAG: hypothetical protein SCH70_07625 [Candidatus Methanoperedens sp.]|nr:hypothetical protein [Candidatus Methanoperedens sp.]
MTERLIFIDVSENGKRLSIDIHSCFKKLRDFLDRDPPIEERREKKAIFEKELEDIVAKYSDFKELKKPLTYIKNGFEELEKVLRQELCLS